jgi:plastocyanin
MLSLHKTKLIGQTICLVLLFIGFLFISSCGKDDSYTTNSTNNTATPGANEIFISGMAFSPASKTIAIGTTIKWINKDGTAHTVTSGTPGSPSGTFNSGNFGQNGEFSFKFDQAGTFKYFCNIHQSMTGTIIVQ